MARQNGIVLARDRVRRTLRSVGGTKITKTDNFSPPIDNERLWQDDDCPSRLGEAVAPSMLSPSGLCIWASKGAAFGLPLLYVP